MLPFDLSIEVIKACSNCRCKEMRWAVVYLVGGRNCCCGRNYCCGVNDEDFMNLCASISLNMLVFCFRKGKKKGTDLF